MIAATVTTLASEIMTSTWKATPAVCSNQWQVIAATATTLAPEIMTSTWKATPAVCSNQCQVIAATVTTLASEIMTSTWKATPAFCSNQLAGDCCHSHNTGPRNHDFHMEGKYCSHMHSQSISHDKTSMQWGQAHYAIYYAMLTCSATPII